MKGLKIYSENEVKQDVKKLCDLNAKCGCGIDYYTINVKSVKKYVINSNKRIYTLDELETIYLDVSIERKIVKKVIKNLPDINIEFDDWDFIDRSKYGIYENENLEIEIGKNLVTIDLKVTEKNDNTSEDFDSPRYYTKSNLTIDVRDITIENEDFGKINILDRDYNSLLKVIIKNIYT